MNALVTIEGGAPVRVGPFAGFAPAPRPDPASLQFVRAVGLAQTRLQLAVLSGNRRRALREIDRLLEIDRQLERLARAGEADSARVSGEEIEAHLASQKLAIAGEKLALTAAITLPTLAPPGETAGAEATDPAELGVVEDDALGGRLARTGPWLAAIAVAVGALAFAVPLLAATAA